MNLPLQSISRACAEGTALGSSFGDTAVLDQDSRGLNTRIRGIDDRATYERDLFPVCGGGEE